jgi:hypothetical protein
MLFKVYLMRHHGVRIPWKEMKVGPYYVGTIVTFYARRGGGNYRVASLSEGGRNVPYVRELYEPTLLGFAPNAFRIRGFERIDHPQAAFGAVQEWHVEEPTDEEIKHGNRQTQPGAGSTPRPPVAR